MGLHRYVNNNWLGRELWMLLIVLFLLICFRCFSNSEHVVHMGEKNYISFLNSRVSALFFSSEDICGATFMKPSVNVYYLHSHSRPGTGLGARCRGKQPGQHCPHRAYILEGNSKLIHREGRIEHTASWGRCHSSNIYCLLHQAACRLRPNVIYLDKVCLSLVQVHNLFSGVRIGNLYLSMSHFPRADYLTLKGERGGSKSALKRWGVGMKETDFTALPLPEEQRTRVRRSGTWSVQSTLKWRLRVRVRSNFMHFFRFPWTDLDSSSFLRDLKANVILPSLSLSQHFPFYCSEMNSCFKCNLNVTYAIRLNKYLLDKSNEQTNECKICYK